jgi:predicted dehydrogenase
MVCRELSRVLRVATTDHRELLEQDEIEAVYCAVPHNLHAELYIDVIESGRHLLGEKPFGIDLEANARIMTAIREHLDVFVRVSSEFPFYPGAQRVVRAFNEGAFGQILEVRSGFRHSYDQLDVKASR